MLTYLSLEHITALEEQKKQIDEEVDRILIQKEQASSKNDLAGISRLVTQLTDLNFKQVEIEGMNFNITCYHVVSNSVTYISLYYDVSCSRR